MKKTRILSIILAGALLLGSFAACAPQAPGAEAPTPAPPSPPQQATTPAAQPTPAVVPDEAPEIGRGVVVVTQNEPPSIAPGRHHAVAGGYMNAMHYNALFRLDSDTLMPVPDLVYSWVAISDTVFEFTIRQGVLFHNGDELTAYDIAASWDHVREFPDARASRESIVYYEVVDRYTIRVDSVEPNAMLFIDLSHNSNTAMPRSLLEAGHDFQVEAVGTGPFIFQYWRAGDTIHSTIFENYFDRDRAPRVEYVTWRVIPEGASRTIALETGEADYNVYVAFSDIGRLEDHPGIEVRMLTGTSHNKLIINNDLPQFSDQRVRRAMAMAVDIESAIVVGMDGFAIPTRASVPIVFPGGTDEGTFSFDPEGARALLAEVGVDPETLGFAIIASNEERRRMGEVFQANLAEIGIPVTVEMNDLATTLQRTTDGDFEAGFGGFNASSFLGYVRAIKHENNIGGGNRSRIRSQELSDLVDQAIATVDETARIAIFEEISRVANEHTGHIPTHMAMVVRAFNSNLAVPELPASGALWLNLMYWRQ